jgi:hypothetical protein
MNSISIIIFLIISNSLSAKEYNLYLDADMTVHKESGLSIKRGIETALSMYHKNIDEFTIHLKVLDHRGNTRRSLANFKRAQKDVEEEYFRP